MIFAQTTLAHSPLTISMSSRLDASSLTLWNSATLTPLRSLVVRSKPMSFSSHPRWKRNMRRKGEPDFVLVNACWRHLLHTCPPTHVVPHCPTLNFRSFFLFFYTRAMPTSTPIWRPWRGLRRPTRESFCSFILTLPILRTSGIFVFDWPQFCTCRVVSVCLYACAYALLSVLLSFLELVRMNCLQFVSSISAKRCPSTSPPHLRFPKLRWSNSLPTIWQASSRFVHVCIWECEYLFIKIFTSMWCLYTSVYFSMSPLEMYKFINIDWHAFYIDGEPLSVHKHPFFCAK